MSDGALTTGHTVHGRVSWRQAEGGLPVKLIYMTALMLVLVACGGGATDVTEVPVDTTTPTATSDTVSEPETTTTTQADSVESTTTTTVVESASSDDLAMFREAAVASGLATSGRFEATMMLAASEELPEPFTIYIEGSFNSDRMEMKMDMSEAFEGAAASEGIDLTAFGDLSDVRFIFDGDTAYMKFPLFAIMGVQTDWVVLPSDDAINSAGIAGVGNTTPANALAAFLDAGGEASIVGTETIRGASTTHYRILFDVEDLETMAGDVSAQELRDSGIEQMPVDVWISDDNLVYRYVISYEGVAEVPVLDMQYDMYDYGENIVIDLPNEDNVTPMDSFGP